MQVVRVPRFSPAASGFHFANSFPSQPLRQVVVPLRGTISIGDAANGLCGGMSYAVGDLWAAAAAPPADTSPPPGDSPAFDYLVDRQIDSFDAGRVPLRFYALMSPVRPDRDPPWAAVIGRFGIDEHSRTFAMVAQEWPAIRADLDGGRPSMLGLIRVISPDPRQLGRNHQVVAFGYDLDGSALTLHIYDPNWPGEDVTLGLDVGDAGGFASPSYSKPDGGVFCFFRTPWSARGDHPWR